MWLWGEEYASILVLFMSSEGAPDILMTLLFAQCWHLITQRSGRLFFSTLTMLPFQFLFIKESQFYYYTNYLQNRKVQRTHLILFLFIAFLGVESVLGQLAFQPWFSSDCSLGGLGSSLVTMGSQRVVLRSSRELVEVQISRLHPGSIVWICHSDGSSLNGDQPSRGLWCSSWDSLTVKEVLMQRLMVWPEDPE